MKFETVQPERLRAIRSDRKGAGESFDKWKEARTEAVRTRPFVAWDGEGYTNEFGQHRYSLFGNSLGARVEKPVLTWKDCINLLMESPKDAIHVIFAGTYDVVMMFHATPIMRRMLEDGDGVVWNGYRIVFRRGKYLRITDLKAKQTRTLYDVFTFFRSSFVASCREYGVGSDELLSAVERMKGRRANFATITDEVKTYMGQELDLLVQLCDSLRDRLALVNIHPSAWHGPGAVASAVLRSHGIAGCKGVYDDEFRKCAESAYYGGRFEQFKRGTFIGDVYQYDIRSAYPAAMCQLPDLSTVTWEHRTIENGRLTRTHSDYALYRIECRDDVQARDIGRLPHRDDKGTIYFPPWTNGWYWGIECRHIPWTYRKEVWYPNGEGILKRPFREWVTEAYRQRAILKRAKQPQQIALKLMLNSLYGKLAQSKGASRDGHGWKYPAFHETVWAGWITAYTRQHINEALHSVPVESLIATETDSVFTTVPIPYLTVGEGLGEWELTMSDGIRYIQSGVSLVLAGGKWSFKTRGFTVKPTTSEVEVWERFITEGVPITVRQTRFGTDPRQRKFAEWYTMDRQLSLDGSAMEKRVHVECDACRRGDGYGNALHDMVACPITYAPSYPYPFVWREDDKPPVYQLRLVIEDVADDPILEMEYLTKGAQK